MKKILYLILAAAAVILPSPIFAENSWKISDSGLASLLNAQQKNSRAWAANEAFRETGMLQYDISRSALYPRISADLSGSGTNSFISRTPSETGDIELKNNYTLSAVPTLSISQLLPTAGILTGSISDTLYGEGLEQSNNPLVPASDLEFSNSVSFSIGITQPLFFGNAYQSSLTQMNESRDISRITYMDNRNALISAAFNDYYQLLLAAVQQNLIEARLNTNIENEKRMEREHELGMWTRAQINSAKAVRLQSEADLLKAQHAFLSLKNAVLALYGTELEIDPETADINELPFTFELDFSDGSLLLMNTENLLNEKNVRIAEASTVIKKKDSAAELSLGSSYSISTEFDVDSFTDSLSFSLGLSVPVSDGGYSSKSIALKETEAERLRQNALEQQKRSLTQLQSLVNNLEIFKRLSDIYLLQEEAASFDVDKGYKELELGRITQKDLLELQIALENSRLSILSNKIDYNLTILQIHKLLGSDLKELINE